MVLLNIKLDNFLVFNDFQLCTAYPKKIVGSTIREEHLANHENFRYKKVKASHFTKSLLVISPDEISQEEFEHAFATTGYRILSYNKEEAIRKFLSWR